MQLFLSATLLCIDTTELKVLIPLRILKQVLRELLLKANTELVTLVIARGRSVGPRRVHDSETGRDGIEGEAEGVRLGETKVGLAGSCVSPLGREVAHRREAIRAEEEGRLILDGGDSSERSVHRLLRDAVGELANVPRLKRWY